MSILISILIGYLAVSACAYIIGLLHDGILWFYGVKDQKFPFLSMNTQIISISICFLWLPIAIGLIYLCLTKSDHQHKGA